jgi:hypothetical protein
MPASSRARRARVRHLGISIAGTRIPSPVGPTLRTRFHAACRLLRFQDSQKRGPGLLRVSVSRNSHEAVEQQPATDPTRVQRSCVDHPAVFLLQRSNVAPLDLKPVATQCMWFISLGISPPKARLVLYPNLQCYYENQSFHSRPIHTYASNPTKRQCQKQDDDKDTGRSEE